MTLTHPLAWRCMLMGLDTSTISNSAIRTVQNWLFQNEIQSQVCIGILILIQYWGQMGSKPHQQCNLPGQGMGSMSWKDSMLYMGPWLGHFWRVNTLLESQYCQWLGGDSGSRGWIGSIPQGTNPKGPNGEVWPLNGHGGAVPDQTGWLTLGQWHLVHTVWPINGLCEGDTMKFPHLLLSTLNGRADGI